MQPVSGRQFWGDRPGGAVTTIFRDARLAPARPGWNFPLSFAALRGRRAMPDLLSPSAIRPPAATVTRSTPQRPGWSRWKTALGSLLSVPLHPLGKLSRVRVAPYRDESRRADGLTLILPGIEGESLLNHDIVLGLVDAGVPGAIEIDDWTSGHPALGLWHLWDRRRHQREARRIADRITRQHQEHPHAPIHLIGHSGGGAMVLLVLEQLPESVRVTTATLLNAAVSRSHDLTRALARLDRGLWNFSAVGDWFFVTLGTLVCRSLDGVHTVCAGAWGFNPPKQSSGSWPGLQERPWNWRDVGRGHGGGHFGCTNRLFVRECVAPNLKPEGTALESSPN